MFHRGGMTTPTCPHSYPGVVGRCGCCTCGSSVMGELRRLVAGAHEVAWRAASHQYLRQHPHRHRDGPQQHHKATAGRFIQKFRMQFPRHRIAPDIHIVGIATFVETVERSPNRIACETAPNARHQRARGPSIVRLGAPAIGLTRERTARPRALSSRIAR